MRDIYCRYLAIVSEELGGSVHPTGLRTIGSFINTRSCFRWQQQLPQPSLPNNNGGRNIGDMLALDLEVDQCTFPHGRGYFVRFTPDDQTIMLLYVLIFTRTARIILKISILSQIPLPTKQRHRVHDQSDVQDGAVLPGPVGGRHHCGGDANPGHHCVAVCCELIGIIIFRAFYRFLE